MDERIRGGRRGEGMGRRVEGLAFNYLGFPRQEAIHLRVYAIFEGWEGGREGGRAGEIANGCNGARRQVCPKYYDNIYPNVRVRVADSEASIAPDRRCTRL